jgi:hypothetical protein
MYHRPPNLRAYIVTNARIEKSGERRAGANAWTGVQGGVLLSQVFIVMDGSDKTISAGIAQLVEQRIRNA